MILQAAAGGALTALLFDRHPPSDYSKDYYHALIPPRDTNVWFGVHWLITSSVILSVYLNIKL